MSKRYFCLFLLLCQGALHAGVQSKVVEYKEASATLEGVWFHDDATTGKRPGILVVHQWKGITAYEKMRGEALAKMGYNVFLADIYGKGIRPATPAEAGAMAGKFKGDRALLRARVNAALEQLKSSELTDGTRIAAIGYCFGGTTALELARSGAPVAGVVSFHGGLGSPVPSDARNIKCRVLALHGADDPFVPAAEVAGFEKEMREASVDWQLVSYGNSVHSFTLPDAGSDNSKGAAYNEKADKRSWKAMQDFFAEIFAR